MRLSPPNLPAAGAQPTRTLSRVAGLVSLTDQIARPLFPCLMTVVVAVDAVVDDGIGEEEEEEGDEAVMSEVA